MKTYTISQANLRAEIPEQNDCGVIAYSIAKAIPYYEAHKLFKDAGRRDNHGTSTPIVERVLNKPLERCCVTLKEFIFRFPLGRFWICSRTHAVAVIDGIVFDYKPRKGNMKILRYTEVKI